MVEENEIMCGNYFIHNDNWCSREHKGIFQFDSQHFFELHECTFSLENISPIPLTEDILIRCGFEKIENNWKVFDMVFANVSWERLAGMTLSLEHERIFLPHIKYLHQMQNLVKLLCNQTIELK